jgi:RimJ/RimL family protein N-acetyltransferase
VPIEIDTPRLRLRKFRNEDHDPYAALCADEDVMRYLGTGVVLTRAEAWRSMAAILGHWQLLGYGMWAVESKRTGEFLGRVGFLDPPGWPGFEIGWVIGKPHWGQGYAPEAAAAALAFAFEKLDRERVISLIRPGNERSVRVATKLGERLAGEVDLLGSKAMVYEVTR